MHKSPPPWVDTNDLQFSREQGFFDKNPTVRWIIGLFFFLILFCFLHFREVRVEILELNSIAPRYIVSQIDFDFFDEEATIILKQEAVRDVGKIYQISPKEWRHYKEYLDPSLHTQTDGGKKDGPSLESLHQSAHKVFLLLKQNRFTDPFTIQKMKEVGLPTDHYSSYSSNEDLTIGILPSPIWNQVVKTVIQQADIPSESRPLLQNLFREQKGKIEEDIPAQQALREKIQSQIPNKKTHVLAGDRIIDQGERVAARHLMMLQAMKKALADNRNLWHPLTILGSLFMTFILIALATAYLYYNHPLVLFSNQKLFLLISIMVLTMGLAKIGEFFLLSSQSPFIEDIRFPLFVPFAAILLSSLIYSGVALFISGFLTVILMMSLALENETFVLINLSASIVAMLSMRTIRRRKDIFTVCLKAWVCSIAIIIATHLYQNSLWSLEIVTDLASASIFLLITAVLVVGLLPLLESAFHIMTDVSLMEYMDPNNDLLRRLSIEAPGTYQHSVVVGNLAETAALSINANGLFCRVATLYHDIGKMETAQYFTENQVGEMNIHQLLTPLESAQVIMAHVPEGVALARKAGLPEEIIDIIKEHHGTTLVYYFYRKQLEKMGGDKSLVDENEFRYPGPKPKSKESALIMIADSFEAASRSIEQFSEEALLTLIDQLIRDKWEDGQLDDSLLTFQELVIVKKNTS